MSVGVALAGPVSARADGLLDGGNVVGTATSALDDPVGTVTSTADDTVGTATTNAGSAVETVISTSSSTAGSFFGDPNAASQTPGTAALSAESTSGDSGETSSPNRRRAAGSHGDRKVAGRSYHTRFDRLPRRAEMLMERIELGRDLRANLRRLEALLRDSPGLRAELARALRAELVRLREGGLTHAERRQVRLLLHVQRALAHSTGASSSILDSTFTEAPGSLSPGPLAGVESAANAPRDVATESGVAGAHAQREANGSGRDILGSLPSVIDSWPRWVMILLDVVIGLCFTALAAIILLPLYGAFRELR